MLGEEPAMIYDLHSVSQISGFIQRGMKKGGEMGEIISSQMELYLELMKTMVKVGQAMFKQVAGY